VSILVSGTSTITVQLKDANGNNLTASGGTVTLNADNGATIGTVTDNGDGTYTATLTAPASPATVTVSGSLNGNPLANTASVTVS
jgi:adhesin/invasin